MNSSDMNILSSIAPCFFMMMILSCTPSSEENHSSSNEVESDQANTSFTLLKTYTPAKGKQVTLEMKEIKDPQTGMVNQYIPMPASWRVTPTAIESPKGSKLQEFPGASFSGQQRYVGSIDDILQQDIPQMIQQNNATYLRTLDLPEVTKRDEMIGNQYWQAMPMQKVYQTKGVEITDNEGNPALLVVHYAQSSNEFGVHHFYYMHVLSSGPGRYESDKEVTLFALANLQSNPEAVTLYNKKMQEEYIRREQMHAAKMKQAWDHFNAWNQNHVRTWSDINESSMASWRRQQDMVDAGQAKSVDAISERERLVNPFDGRQLEVDAGYKYYYTNAFGEVIGSNDEFFDPAQNPELNNQEWKKATFE